MSQSASSLVRLSWASTPTVLTLGRVNPNRIWLSVVGSVDFIYFSRSSRRSLWLMTLATGPVRAIANGIYWLWSSWPFNYRRMNKHWCILTPPLSQRISLEISTTKILWERWWESTWVKELIGKKTYTRKYFIDPFTMNSVKWLANPPTVFRLRRTPRPIYAARPHKKASFTMVGIQNPS